ncbi:MAG: carbohydrate-binding protein [Bacteroidales bacterium]|nr:carbohydrate-binding protein [Bacteroidales bacterium]
MKKTWLLFTFLSGLMLSVTGQEYLHTEGKYIYSGTGEEVILRGIGTGNWMLQEGYMMQSGDVAATQHEFRNLLISTVGESRTDSFYNAWLSYHFTRSDVDSMKAWGFNSIRVAMHYKWFTLPIEDEPVSGKNTWLDKGFTLIDSLLDWCSDNELYLILDMHGTPGGQGTDAAISDYDDTKPSLWESQENKDKLIALWDTLAERYSTKKWIGGYDLINEPNWTMTNNTALWNLYQAITGAIRAVDTNHMIIIEGNWFANDYSGVPAPWDDNIVYSFHKYWTFNDPSSLSWMEDIRDTYNVPIWLGESGENSNTWFTNLITLCESKSIGWSWWPVKKSGINNVLRVITNEDYSQLITDWTNGTTPNADEAFAAVLQYAENHKIENCVVQYDVIDAMIRQPHSSESLPFGVHQVGEPVFACQYDLGRNHVAYFDQDTANYHLEDLPYTNWNQGWSYRNDGVDIETCNDTDENMGYNVGWTANDEWLLYTLTTDSAAAYTLTIRYASGSTGAKVRFESDGIPVSPVIDLPSTGSWQNWASIALDSIVLPAGEQKIKLHVVQEGFNLNYFRFSDPIPAGNVSLKPVYAWCSRDGKTISLFVNQEITTDPAAILPGDFSLLANKSGKGISTIEINPAHPQEILIHLSDSVYYGDVLRLGYSGSSIESAAGTLAAFTDMTVINRLPVRHTIPGLIQAEDFQVNYGFTLEACTDAGEGYNTAYASAGDYLDYPVYVTQGMEYGIEYRVATTHTTSELILQTNATGSFASLDTFRFSSTGGWQNWTTQTAIAFLQQGHYTLRLLVKQGEHNLNWIRFTEYEALADPFNSSKIRVFPNPSSDQLFIRLPETVSGPVSMKLYNIAGELITEDEYTEGLTQQLDLSGLEAGPYFVYLSANKHYFRPVKVLKTD